MLEQLLGSSVITVIISAAITIWGHLRTSKSEIQANEEKQRRENIMSIIEQLSDATYSKTVKLIARLKGLINVWGKHSVSKDVMKDSHIWDIIKRIELGKSKFFLVQRNTLSTVLELQLQRERDTLTIENAIKERMLSNCLCFFSITYIAIECFINSNQCMPNNLLLNISVSLFLVMIILLSTFGLQKVVTNFTLNIGKSYIEVGKEKVYYADLYFLGSVFAFVVTIAISSMVVIQIAQSAYISTVTGTICIFTYMLGVFLMYVKNYEEDTMKLKYISTVEKIMEEYEKLMNE